MADHETMFNLGYHPNIVQLYGVCPATAKNPVMLCMEFMEVCPDAVHWVPTVTSAALAHAEHLTFTAVMSHAQRSSSLRYVWAATRTESTAQLLCCAVGPAGRPGPCALVSAIHS